MSTRRLRRARHDVHRQGGGRVPSWSRACSIKVLGMSLAAQPCGRHPAGGDESGHVNASPGDETLCSIASGQHGPRQSHAINSFIFFFASFFPSFLSGKHALRLVKVTGCKCRLMYYTQKTPWPGRAVTIHNSPPAEIRGRPRGKSVWVYATTILLKWPSSMCSTKDIKSQRSKIRSEVGDAS